MFNEPITVTELLEILQLLIKQGKGDLCIAVRGEYLLTREYEVAGNEVDFYGLA